MRPSVATRRQRRRSKKRQIAESIDQRRAATRFALYQSPAFILAASIGALRSRDLLRLGAATVVLGSIAVLFL